MATSPPPQRLAVPEPRQEESGRFLIAAMPARRSDRSYSYLGALRNGRIAVIKRSGSCLEERTMAAIKQVQSVGWKTAQRFPRVSFGVARAACWAEYLSGKGCAVFHATSLAVV
ncbi:hypothetical protein thsps117_22070 [Pseudomonas sp. No.117]